MITKNRIVPIFLRSVFVVIVLPGLFASMSMSNISDAKAQGAPTETPTSDEVLEIQKSVQYALDNSSHLFVKIFDVGIDKITYRDNWAVIILQLYEKGTTNLVATEPGIAVAWKNEARWVASIPGDKDWGEKISLIPEELLSQEMKDFLTVSSNQTENLPNPEATYSGYYLPWPSGVTHRLTQSISHPSSLEYYAFDFADTGNPLFEITASRSGVVWYAVWTYPNGYDDGDCNHANYVVVKNDIGLYDVYLHLAQDSIPSDLRTRGNPVLRGEKIGNADDTGCSGGHHLHFQAHTNPNSWYGQSVDITFADVSVCGGRPRLPAENSCTTTNYYTSGNTRPDSTPPTTSASLSGTTGENGWYLSAVQVALSAVDNSGGSGVSQTQYQIDSNTGTWQIYSVPFSVSADGVHTVYYKSVDAAGNWETEKNTVVKIDTTSPTGSFVIQNGSTETYSTTVELNTQGNDSTSGIAAVRFRDAGQVTWSSWYAPGSVFWQLIGSNGQTASVEAQFKDNAVNVSAVYLDSININLYPSHPSSSLYILQRSTFGASGMSVSSSQYVLNGTAGQPTIIGYMESSNYKMNSGYWAMNETREYNLFLPLILR